MRTSIFLLLLCVWTYSGHGQPFNRYLSLDGVDDGIHERGTQLIPDSSDFTLEFYFQACKISSSTKLFDGIPSTAGKGIDIVLPSLNQMYVRMIDDGGFATQYFGNFPINLEASQWYHFAFTYRDADSLCKIFLNGDTVHTFSHGFEWQNFTDFTIGRSNHGGSQTLDGLIDEFRISDIIRYDSSFAPATQPFLPDANTRLLLHLDDLPGDTTFVDASGNGWDFTIYEDGTTAEQPGFSVSDPQGICAGDTVVLQASGGWAYHWEPSQGLHSDTGAQVLASPDQSMAYFVDISYGNNSCVYPDTIPIIVFPTPTVDVGPDTTITLDSCLLFDCGPIAQCQWFGLPGLDLKVTGSDWGLGTHTVWVEITDNQGCVGRDTLLVTVIEGMNTALDPDLAARLQLYPNPAQDWLQLELEGLSFREIRILGLHGNLIHQQAASSRQLRLSVGQLPRGGYWVQVHTDRGLLHKPFWLQ